MFKNKIIKDVGPYVPVDQRPPKWPFHHRLPENPEADVPWIFDWTSKECEDYRRRKGLVRPVEIEEDNTVLVTVSQSQELPVAGKDVDDLDDLEVEILAG